jgi:hypothetical protein
MFLFVISATIGSGVVCFFLVRYIRINVIGILIDQAKNMHVPDWWTENLYLFVTNACVDLLISWPFAVLLAFLIWKILKNYNSEYSQYVENIFKPTMVVSFFSCVFVSNYLRYDILRIPFFSSGNTIQPAINGMIDFGFSIVMFFAHIGLIQYLCKSTDWVITYQKRKNRLWYANECKDFFDKAIVMKD